MWIDAVKEAYSNGDDAAFAKALDSLQRKLIGDVQCLGPAAVALQLGDLRELKTILDKIAAESSAPPAKRVVFVAGFISGYSDYLARMVDQDAVVAADAQLSADRDAHNQAERIGIMILKTAFAYAGVRHKQLVGSVVRAADVDESLVKHHVGKLAKLKLIDRLEVGPKAVSYRISRLGEAVLARHSQPYELALFIVDQAADDEKLRAAMQDEMKRSWPREAIPVFTSSYEKSIDPGGGSNLLNFKAQPYQEERARQRRMCRAS
jgi:hypothetical protein